MVKELRQAIDAVVNSCALMDTVLDFLEDDVAGDAVVRHADVLALAADKLRGRVDALRDIVARLAER